MGCAASKLDQLPAVSLCRDRCHFLDEALQQSYALADAQVAYTRSLKTLGPTLKHFFDQNLKSTSADDSAVSAVKPPEQGSPLSSPDHSLSSSNSDSHIQFDTDLEDEETDKDKSYHNFNGDTYQNSEFIGSDWITPPPPAPRSGAWDYLNFFDELYERYELRYSSNNAVKNKEESRPREVKEKQNKEAVSVKNVDDAENKQKKVESNQKTIDVNESKNESGKQSVSELMNELQALFDKASNSGNQVLQMLDTGKFRYHHKKSVYQGSTKIFHMISSNSSETESLLSKEKIIGSMESDEIVSLHDLSSVMRKLCMWETKLYDEVKAEEKLRIIHAKTCRQMKSLNQKAGNARRVNSTRTLIRAVSAKMRVAVQVIDKVAIAINKLMDEELWPQVNELIRRLFGMWKALLECHSSQCQKLMEAKCLDSIALNEKLNDGDLEVAMRLKVELQNWSLSFSSWIEAQRGFVKALNGWLRKCLLYEPDETSDGVLPFSPGSGSPLVFVILNKWSEAMESDKLSEKEVVEAIHGLLTSVNRVLEQHSADLQQKIVADKDMERKVKMLEKEEQKMQKLMQARVKKMTRLAREESDVLLPRDTTARRGDIREANSLQNVLKQIFMAMEKLATHFGQAYEELHNCIEESKAAQDNP